jgi:hypothetical protein
VKGKQYELCRELDKILHDPINKPLMQDFTTTEIAIPKGYPDFRKPKWEKVTLEELLPYFSQKTKDRGLFKSSDNHSELQPLSGECDRQSGRRE